MANEKREIRVGDRVRVARPTPDGDTAGVGETGVVSRIGASVCYPGHEIAWVECDDGFQSTRVVARLDLVADEKPDPYTASNLTQDAVVAQLTESLPANIAARARLVAALRLELDRPMPKAHPAEGRSDRVFGGRRW